MATSESNYKQKLNIKQLRFFVSSLNTFVGHSIIETIRNDHINDENPHIILGS
jgi:hypothetical protein